MNQDINLVIENFKNSIISQINNSGLPAGVVYYVIKDVFQNTETSYYNYIGQLRREAELHDASKQAVPQENVIEDETDKS